MNHMQLQWVCHTVPLVLTVLLVQGDTLCLSVRLIHSLVLINTDLLVVCLALLHHLHLVLSVPDSGVVGHAHQLWLLLYDLCWLWLDSGWWWSRSSIGSTKAHRGKEGNN